MDPEPAQPLGGARKIMVRCHAWVLFRMIYRSAGFRRDSEALVQILLWAGFYLGLLKLLSSPVWALGHLSQKKRDLVLPCGRILFANKLQISSKHL